MDRSKFDVVMYRSACCTIESRIAVSPITSSGNRDDNMKKKTLYNATLPTHEMNNNMIIIINNNGIGGEMHWAAAAVINRNAVVVGGAPVRVQVRLLLVLTTANRRVPGSSRLDSRTRLFSYSAVRGGSRRRTFRSDRRQK